MGRLIRRPAHTATTNPMSRNPAPTPRIARTGRPKTPPAIGTVISGIEGVEKPDSRIYELALERAGVAADESVFVGDNPEFDVIPPSELGMFTVS